MICRIFVWRDGKVFEFPARILDEAGLKKGGQLIFDFDSATKMDWHEHEAVFVVVGNVEIIGLVLGYDRGEGSDQSKNPQRVTIEKVSIKENPNMLLSYNDKEDRTVLTDPEETEVDEKHIGISLMEANAGRRQIPLQMGAELLGKADPVGKDPIIVMKTQLQLLASQNKQQQEAITQLQNKYDKMNEEVQELIENYIPDLSNELSDEG